MQQFNSNDLSITPGQQYKLLYIISNNIEVYVEPVHEQRDPLTCLTMQLNLRPMRRIELYESLYWDPIFEQRST